MPSIQLSNVSFAHRDSTPLFEAVDLVVGSGWTGVVGANGAGKTTLLRLIAGDLAPDTGTIEAPRSPVYCPQVVETVDDRVRTFADAWSSDAFALRGRLGLTLDDIDRWDTLSPGERKRWQVGAALAADPALLMLDEPTNHIDTAARDLLIEALRRYRGIGLVVSHDRQVLNELCQRTARIHRQGLTLWNGPYDTASQGWERAAASAAETKTSLRTEERRMGRLADRQRRTMEAKDNADRRTVREAGVRDRDARSMEAKIRRAQGAQTAARRAGQSGARAARAGGAADALWVDKELGSSIFIGYEQPGRRVLLSYEGAVQAGNTILADHVAVSIERESRVWLRGPNGAGKTTLLRCLIDASTLAPDRVVWLPQDQSESERQAVLAAVEEQDNDARGRTLNVVAALGVDPGRLRDSAMPSPGEARKLTLALGLANHAWCLVLDEPTNHLDLPSIERLEDALDGYPGALLLVSHDERFAATLTDSTWTIGEGRLIA